MRRDQLDPAVPTGTDPHRYARLLAAVHEAAVSGSSPPVRPRSIIEQSWSRVQAGGLDPDRGCDPAPLPPDEVQRRRRANKLGEFLPQLRGELVTVADEASHIMVVADADGRVLWRDGSTAVRRRADTLTFVEGADWSERTVGTNAIGTALATGRPSGTWEHRLTPRHAEILYVLAHSPEGRSAASLAEDLFGDTDRTTTIRAEMPRLRRHLGGVLAQRPYRFDERVEVRVQGPAQPAELLPTSSAPGVLRLRDA